MKTSDKSIQTVFKKRIKKTDGCWYFTKLNGEIIPEYPQFMWKGVSMHAHRVSYLMHNGDVSDGKNVFRSCHNKGCINPEHLQAGSFSEIALHVVEKGRNRLAVKTHCIRGHELNEENTRVRTINGRPRRSCKACVKVLASSRNQ